MCRRYTRSFVGLMEENKDGEWVKYKEVEKREKEFYESLEESSKRFEELSLYTDIEESFLKGKLRKNNNLVKSVIFASCCITTLETIYTVAQYA